MRDRVCRFSLRLVQLGIIMCLVLMTNTVGVEASSDESPLASFRLGDEVFEFHHAVAFRTTKLKSRLGEETLVVVLTRDKIDEEEVAVSVAEQGNWFGSGHVRLTLRFRADGTFIWAMFQGGANNLQLDSDKIDATTEIETSRVSGTFVQREPSVFFDDEYVLQAASFDVTILAEQSPE